MVGPTVYREDAGIAEEDAALAMQCFFEAASIINAV